MPGHPDRTARSGSRRQKRAYREGHQACASCGIMHQVYKGQRGTRLEYYCPACDFFAFHDNRNGQFYAAAGHGIPEVAHVLLATSPVPR